MNEGYLFLGMNTIWWIIWLIILFWIFTAPTTIPSKHKKKESSDDPLNQKLDSSEIKHKQNRKEKILED